MLNKKQVEELLSLLKMQMTTEQEISMVENFEKDLLNYSDEVWREIEGSKNLQVSNKGRVRSSFHGEGWLILKGCVRQGYRLVHVKDKNKLVHVLVAKAFIPNPENKPEVNHKDGNKLNNCVENLEWVTHMENIRHACETGIFRHTTGLNANKSVLKKEEVRYIRKHYKPRDKEWGAPSLAKKFGVSPQTIYRAFYRITYRDVE